MPDEPTKDARDKTAVAVPGMLCVGPTRSGRRVVYLGPAAGWMIPEGIFRWEKEVSFVARADMSAQLAKALHATLPHEQIAPKRFERATSAVKASPLLALSSNLIESARKEGVRVHTVGVDRVSADFYYFAEGGTAESLRAQGNLVEMLGDRLSAAATNADIEALEDLLINRLLSELSKGLVSELEVELADALPRLSRDGTGLAGTDLEAFEARAAALAQDSAPFEAAGRQLADALADATRQGQSQARVPLYGEAERETMAPLEVVVMGKPLLLPECFVWTVRGAPGKERLEAPEKPAPRPAPAGARETAPAIAAAAVTGPAPAPPTAAASAAGAATASASATASAGGPAAASVARSAAEPATASAQALGPPSATAAASSSARARESAAERGSAAASSSRAAAAKVGVGVKAKPAQKPASVARSAFVPILLLLGLVSSLYFLWRSLP